MISHVQDRGALLYGARGVGLAALLLFGTAPACAPERDNPPPRKPTLHLLDWDGEALQRDNFHPHGILSEGAVPLPLNARIRLRYNGAHHVVHLTGLADDHTGEATSKRYYLDIHHTRPPLALHQNSPNILDFLLDSNPDWAHVRQSSLGPLAAPQLRFGVVPGSPTEYLLFRVVIRLDLNLLLLPVYTWNINGAVADLDKTVMRFLFDKAPETDPQGSLWAHQRVDEIWAQCNIQFRLIGHSNGPTLPDCWTHPIVSSQSALNSSCTTSNPACRADSETSQDFLNCTHQQENRCTLWELVKASHEQPGYSGPTLFKQGAINVYFARQLDLYEDTTLGIGCAGEYPMIVINDLWKDHSGLRVAHELGHVMGIDHHIPSTVMSDGDQRTDWVDDTTCLEVRRYIEEHHLFIPWN